MKWQQKRYSGEKRKIVLLLMDCDVRNGIGDGRGISEIKESS